MIIVNIKDKSCVISKDTEDNVVLIYNDITNLKSIANIHTIAFNCDNRYILVKYDIIIK